MSNPFLNISVGGTPARIYIQPVWSLQELLVPEAEKLLVELRNAINSARRQNAPQHKFTDLT